MRAITLIQPMAAAIVIEHPFRKDVENRPRNLPKAMRGVETTIAVHAGKKFDDGYGMFVFDIFEKWPPAAHIESAVVGVMTLTGRVFTSQREANSAGRGRWFGGPFGYEIKSAVPLARPVACRGMQGWWTLPSDVEIMVVNQLKERTP